MLVNRSSSELSGHQNHERNQKVTSSPNDKRVGCGAWSPTQAKRGLEWATQNIGCWCSELVIHLSTRLRESAARDDKGEGDGSIKSGCWTEVFFITLGGPQAHDSSVEKHFQERSAEPQIPPLRYPGFPVEVSGADEFHAAFLNESRTRGPVRRSEAGNPGSLRSG